MTTKFRIILGFVIMMALMGGIAFLGYKDLGNSSDRFNKYRRYARINVTMSDIMANLGFAGTSANAYVLGRDEKNLAASLKFMEAMDKLFVEASNESQVQANQDALAALRKMAADYASGLQALGVAIENVEKQYSGVVLPNSAAMAKLLSELAAISARVDNTAGLHSVEQVWGPYSSLLSALGQYGYSRSPAEIATAESNISQMRLLLEKVGGLLVSAEGKALHGKLMEASNAVFTATADMKKNGEGATKVISSLGALRGKFTEDVSKFNAGIDSEMRAIGTETTTANEQGQLFLMGISAGGIVLAGLIALFIIVGIIRVLTELSGFAGAIANGDFSRQIKTREKGEIGSTVEAMKRIPAVLQRVIADIGGGVGMVQSGHYRARLKPADYPGAYGDLVSSVNTVAEAYTKTLDELPVPIMTADGALSVHFANTASQEAVKGSLLEEIAKDANGGKVSFGKRAMESGRNYSTETKANSGGKDMHFAVTAVPLISSGKPVGFIEILTDLTEIRGQQAVMLKVANQASEISNRVAAASEELAAQVEQISRGAEVQRERVESTASAMTEMNATVLEVARSAGEAADQSEGTRAKAQEGAQLVNEVMQAINAVNAVGQNLQVNMQELGKQAENIGNVMSVISDVADQTNLLALNAAIEAARAGEAGRGFAVVADEVRKLAERTMEATREVGSYIDAVQHSARINIDEVGKAVASVAEANGLANSSGTALSEIVKLAASSSAVVASIATAAEEQSATSDEISRAIDEINAVVGETTEGMVQSSSAVQDLSRMAQELRRVMDGLK